MTKELKFTGRTAGRVAGAALPLAAAAWLIGAAPAAQAAAIAYSNLHIENFQILDSSGAQFDASDFQNLFVGNSTSASANLAGTGISDDQLSGGGSDVALQCLGSGCGGIAENDFSQQADGRFSRADAQLQGSVISGLGGASSASADSLGELRIDAASASSGATVGTASEFSFSLGSEDSLTFQFDATPYLDVALDGGTGQAQASVAFSIQITDEQGQSVYSWAPNGTLDIAGGEGSDPFSLNTSRGQLNAGGKTYDPGTGTFTATTGVLASGQTYTLSINHQSSTSGRFTAVPEPATLLMLGAGLLGLGVAGRRRKA